MNHEPFATSITVPCPAICLQAKVEAKRRAVQVGSGEAAGQRDRTLVGDGYPMISLGELLDDFG